MKQHLQDELVHLSLLSLLGFHCSRDEEKIYTWKRRERVGAAGRAEKQELRERGKAALLLWESKAPASRVSM